MDLIAEWHARRQHRDLVPVWPLHRVQVADEVAGALATAGIEAHLRGLNHRATLHFFAPYVPISVMVREERAADAHRLLRDRLGSPDGER
jgi:hypothetical protein